MLDWKAGFNYFGPCRFPRTWPQELRGWERAVLAVHSDKYNGIHFRSDFGAIFRFGSGHEIKVKRHEADGADALQDVR